jgi:predicted kinase
MKLTIVRGIPGSGKSTYAKKLNVFHVESDMFCMIDGNYQWSQETAFRNKKRMVKTVQMMLAYGADVVVSDVFVTRESINQLVKLAVEFGASYEVIRLKSDFQDIHGVPNEVLEGMKAGFQNYCGEKCFQVSIGGEYYEC